MYIIELWYKNKSDSSWVPYETNDLEEAIKCLQSWIKDYPNLSGRVVKVTRKTVYKLEVK